MKNYQWNAEDYEVHSAAQQKWANELIEKLSLSGNESLLDVGCGDGKVTAAIARRLAAGTVIGIDSSPSMIALAQQRHGSEDYPNLGFMCMDARQILLPQRFDIAFSNAALHWVDDHAAVLRGLFDHLHPGGRIILQMGGKGNAAFILAVMDDIISGTEWQPYFENFSFPYTFLDCPEYETLLLKAGFENLRVQLLDKNMEHQGSEGLAGWIRTTWLPYTERVPENKREQFINLIVNNYIEKMPADADGIVRVAMVRIEVEAQKPKP